MSPGTHKKARSLYPGMRPAAATAIGELGQQGAAEPSSPSAGMTRRFAVNPRQGAIRLAANDADAAEGDKPPARRALHCVLKSACASAQTVSHHAPTRTPMPRILKQLSRRLSQQHAGQPVALRKRVFLSAASRASLTRAPRGVSVLVFRCVDPCASTARQDLPFCCELPWLPCPGACNAARPPQPRAAALKKLALALRARNTDGTRRDHGLAVARFPCVLIRCVFYTKCAARGGSHAAWHHRLHAPRWSSTFGKSPLGICWWSYSPLLPARIGP